jgi:hypothetical protein
LIPVTVRTAWAAWQAAPIYLIQSPDGTKELGPLPGAGVDFFLPLVIAWLNGDFINPVAPHLIPEYIRRGCLMCDCPKWPFTPELWAIIFPLGCPPMAMVLGGPQPAGGELAIAAAHQAEGNLALTVNPPIIGALGLGDEAAPAELRDLVLTANTVEPMDCGLCSFDAMPTILQVTLECPGVPSLDGRVFFITFDDTPGYCNWWINFEALDGGIMFFHVSMIEAFFPSITWGISWQEDGGLTWFGDPAFTVDFVCNPFAVSGSTFVDAVGGPGPQALSFLCEEV